MPTISLPPVTTTSPSSTQGLRRTGHNNRRRDSPSTPKRSRSRRVSSIHASPPPISDRESSLYPHRVFASPGHDWSKSCNDLGLGFGASTYTLLQSPPPPSTTATTTQIYPLQQELTESISAIYGTRSLACLGQYNDDYTSSSLHLHGTHWAGRSLVGLTTTTAEQWDLVDQQDHRYTATPTHYGDSRSGSGSGSSSPTLTGQPVDRYYDAYPQAQAQGGRSVHFLPLPTKVKRSDNKWYTRSFWRINIRRRSTSMSTPTIPPRSALRPKPSMGELFAPGSTLFTLPVGEPLAKTPSLSSGSDADADGYDDVPARSPTIEEKERGIFFGRKKSAVVGAERDPYKVRDGRGPKESKTGVYTPPTYPGACGPRPSHFPSHVYTPANFQLYPTPNPSPSPSRSSSSDGMAQTPVSPTYRTFGNKTMAGLRRISGQIAQYSHHSPTSPGIAASRDRDSYFSYSSTTSRQSSIGPITPQSAHFPAGTGLGVGLSEKDGLTQTLSSFPMPPSSTPSPPIKRTVIVSDAPKGRRKPVPLAEAEAEVGDDDGPTDGLPVRSSVHAL